MALTQLQVMSQMAPFTADPDHSEEKCWTTQGVVAAKREGDDEFCVASVGETDFPARLLVVFARLLCSF